MKIKFDPKKCTGCQACQMACLDQRDIRPELCQLPLRYVELREGQNSALYYSVGCVHCGACMDACPQQAMKRDEIGFVQIMEESCIGCGLCMDVCPFKVITLTRFGKAKKCDGCAARIGAGLLPACVHTCPTGALRLES